MRLALDPNVAVAYWNGQIVATGSLSLPIFDAGFIQGLTVAEQLRTFDGKLFRLEDHLRRLQHSLEIVGVDPGVSMSELALVVQNLAQCNCRLLEPDDDLAVAIWVTPGPYPKYASIAPAGPNVCCHMHPLDFCSWSARYEAGERLVTSQYRQVSTQSWPAELKCRSRMHYYLADKEAREKEPALAGCCWTSTVSCARRRPPTSSVSNSPKGSWPRVKKRHFPGSAFPSCENWRSVCRFLSRIGTSRRRNFPRPTKFCFAAHHPACCQSSDWTVSRSATADPDRRTSGCYPPGATWWESTSKNRHSVFPVERCSFNTLYLQPGCDISSISPVYIRAMRKMKKIMMQATKPHTSIEPKTVKVLAEALARCSY